MDHLLIDRHPQLREPIAFVAFAGWNDAASAATNAARFMVRRLRARKFGNVDAEDFFDFKRTRPNVRIDLTQARELTWPSCDFYYARNPTGEHDVIIAIGVEPHLRWKTFAGVYATLFSELGVTLAVSLGALMSDVPHTRQVRVTGTAIDAEVGAKLRLSTSRYQGPTGIVGVLQDEMRAQGLATASFWANVPHYITTAQNPPATAALLGRAQTLIGVEFDFTGLTRAAERFISEVNTAISGNPEILEYVKRLEAAHDSGQAEAEADAQAEEATAEPPVEELVTDIEEFLRKQRPPD
jgi:proteasome assembly chaperone (PAC2) family protein